MPRADRLFALVQLLSGPNRRTLDDLARALETSPRSIYRDLADLEARGVPIERNGGRYRLVEGAAVRPVPLTERERLLLTLALENPDLQRQDAFRATLRQLKARLASGQHGSGPTAVLAGPIAAVSCRNRLSKRSRRPSATGTRSPFSTPRSVAASRRGGASIRGCSCIGRKRGI